MAGDFLSLELIFGVGDHPLEVKVYSVTQNIQRRWCDILFFEDNRRPDTVGWAVTKSYTQHSLGTLGSSALVCLLNLSLLDKPWEPFWFKNAEDVGLPPLSFVQG